jgi:hypothetical protein
MTVLAIGLVIVVYGLGQLLIYVWKKVSRRISQRALYLKETPVKASYQMQKEREIIE